jgi:uncharacterized Rmd1/YagE family protein
VRPPILDKVKIFNIIILEHDERSIYMEEILDDLTDVDEADHIEEQIISENIAQTIKLDYKLKTMEERRELVDRIIAATP